MMKLLPTLLGVILTTAGAIAAVPSTNAPAATPPPAKAGATTPAPAAKPDAKNPAPAPVPAAPAAPVTKLDDYFVELVAKVNLTDAEKKQVEGLYTADGVALKNILNDDSLSPLQQAQQVSDLRDVRNEKILQILHEVDRQKEFLQVEAVYRVSLTEFAAEGGLVPPPPAAPAPVAAPAPAPAASTNAAPATPAAPAPAK